MFDYVASLFYRAKTHSENPESNKEVVLRAWDDMTSASKDLIRIYANMSDIVVNGFEKNPYCYLITSYTSKCNYLIQQGRIAEALLCFENAVNSALEMFEWAKGKCPDPLIMSDIMFFVQHTPGWCHNWAGAEMAKTFIENPKFKECKEKIDNIAL